jgi:threonine aldolase
MYSLKNDYSEGAHPRILEALIRTNMEQTVGYGLDEYSKEAKTLIQKLVANEKAQVHFLVGGTQTNQTAIGAFLRPYEAAIAAETGHICVHETGAIEATGHKIVAIKTSDGKLTPALIEEVLTVHTDEHMVRPKLVYISNSTEVGTLYNREELQALYEFCKSKDLYLYMDGARLGAAIASGKTNLTLELIGKYTDAFYIGGTKNGAFFGEALVILREELQQEFRYMIKRQGGMFAKGRLLGIQFLELLKDGLYFELAEHAVNMAMKLKEGMLEKGYEFAYGSDTNLLFPIMTKEEIARLEKNFRFEFIEKYSEDKSVMRLVTSFATTKEGVEEFLKSL